MPMIPTWCPPSREHWELVTFLWQFFPIVWYAIRRGQLSFTDRIHLVHVVPMARQILSHGQDLDGISFQHPRQDRLGYYGGAWLHHAPVLDVRSAEAGGD